MNLLRIILIILTLNACSSFDSEDTQSQIDFESVYPNLYQTFSGNIDFNDLPNYEAQTFPNYINLDNSILNPTTDEGSLLGRILFYDVNLSTDNSVSCSSCHQQGNAFSDTSDVSTGVNGVTGRHSMRLINTRFSRETAFFWDERASTLEEQTTQPIRDHNEMGFSGTSGAPDFADLITKLENLAYYPELFEYAFGSNEITETRMQLALGQFIRSIQSFDSKYDTGRALAGNDNANFSNFTADENAGKTLFLDPPPAGGAGCATCHTPPSFDISPNSLNNGVIGVFGSIDTDLTVTRSPSLRDLFKPDGSNNGAFMHDASFSTIEDVINHYNNGISSNGNLDPRLSPGGSPQNLNLNATEIDQIVQFLKTLSGNNVYTDSKWSDPF